MRYAIVYSSRTGNTALLAQTIRETLPAADCLYFGGPDAAAEAALQADLLYVGFWTDRGGCDADIARFLEQLTSQKVFLFGTAGFGGDPAYFEKILSCVRTHLGPEVRLAGGYLCQGRMPQPVRERYEAMEDGPRRAAMLSNFDRALSHPDARDLENLRAALPR